MISEEDRDRLLQRVESMHAKGQTASFEDMMLLIISGNGYLMNQLDDLNRMLSVIVAKKRTDNYKNITAKAAFQNLTNSLRGTSEAIELIRAILEEGEQNEERVKK